ncbi:Uncharacterised protein [Legionella lansingensis]|nr:Uncharacterised protein [Legionella lansingensis]
MKTLITLRCIKATLTTLALRNQPKYVALMKRKRNQGF